MLPSRTTKDRESETISCEADIVLRDVRMAYDERGVLDGLSCSFPRGKISVVLGGSGVGKSTLLRLVGGLVKPSAGSIEVCRKDITKLPERALYSMRANVGMMFQNGALLDSLSVFDNLAFPLREHSDLSVEQIAEQVRISLDSVGLLDVGGLLPGQLSGGMVKRVALARAMILRPEVLLCDEPFSGLDPISVKRIEYLLTGVNRDLGVTIVAVSHDVGSTLRMADHIVILLPDGTFEGTLEELRAIPDPRLASFLSLDLEEETARGDHEIERAPQMNSDSDAFRQRRPQDQHGTADRSKPRKEGLSRSAD